MSELLSELKTWWKEFLFVFAGALVLFFINQIGWVAAAVIGISILIVGVAVFFYDLGRRATPRKQKVEDKTTPGPQREEVRPKGSKRERVLETVVEVDEGENYELVSYYLEKGQRILVEADSRVHGGHFSLKVLHESDLGTYERDEGPYTLVSKANTVLHRERSEIPQSGWWHFIIEPEWGEDVSVELSLWKL